MKQKQNIIKNNLPKGWRRVINEVTGFTVSYISMVVLNDRPANSQAARQIMDAAIFLAEKNKRDQEEFKRKLEML